MAHAPLILASASSTRRALLAGAGLRFEVLPADVDEGAVAGPPADVARELARRKALAVSARHPDALVIGGDQVLALPHSHHREHKDHGEDSVHSVCSVVSAILYKARNHAEAGEKLAALQGRTHALHCAVAVARGGVVLWSHLARADLTMRALSGADIERYLAAAGPEVTGSVGAYALEGLGAWLFDRVEGDYFTILGLPLLPLLQYLREQHGMGP